MIGIFRAIECHERLQTVEILPVAVFGSLSVFDSSHGHDDTAQGDIGTMNGSSMKYEIH